MHAESYMRVTLGTITYINSSSKRHIGCDANVHVVGKYNFGLSRRRVVHEVDVYVVLVTTLVAVRGELDHRGIRLLSCAGPPMQRARQRTACRVLRWVLG